MGAIMGLKEQRVQFFYDTDFITAGAQDANTAQEDIALSEKILFANARPGSLQRTNMPAPGFLTSDQTFLCFAVRHEINFYGGASPTAPTSAGGAANPAGFQNTAAVSIWTINLSTFAFRISEKVQFEGPVGMTPAGGGPWGFVGDSTQALITNGEPQVKSIYVLPIPVAITKRQGINMVEKKANIAGATAVNILNIINGYTGGKLFRAYIDGYNSRDVL